MKEMVIGAKDTAIASGPFKFCLLLSQDGGDGLTQSRWACLRFQQCRRDIGGVSFHGQLPDSFGGPYDNHFWAKAASRSTIIVISVKLASI